MTEALTISLASHTNVGKTTLMRTLLRKDVGEVADREHVTVENTEYTMLEAPGGRVLRLWDTPGFGDSARLLKRLRRQGNPIGWLLNQAWDRAVNRPLWCTREAVSNVRDEADVVLYLVNAAETPESAGYVEPEMQVLEWVGKPVMVILNQLGTGGDGAAREAEEEAWRRRMESFPAVRDVLGLDAFSRCWVQEGVLLRRMREVVAADKRDLLDALLEAWMEPGRRMFAASMDLVAAHLDEAARDEEKVTAEVTVDAARKRLEERLADSFRGLVSRLVGEHGLEGASREALKAVEKDFDKPRDEVDARRAGIIGGIVSGAVSGLAADILAGGMTLGGGALLGMILGGFGAGGAAHAYNRLFLEADRRVKWKFEALDRVASSALLRYLAVAHYGRGRGEWKDPKTQERWEREVSGRLESSKATWHAAWEAARGGKEGRSRIRERVEETAREVLIRLYPGVEDFLR